MVNDDLFVRLRYSRGIDRIAAAREAGYDTVDRDANTLLHEAAVVGDVEFARHLLASGLGASTVNNRGETALHTAIRNGQPEVAAILLESGCDANAADYQGMSPLLVAIVSGDRGDLIRLLRSFGGDPLLAGSHGYSAVDLARKRNDLALLAILESS
jgi:uncharacterized protein